MVNENQDATQEENESDGPLMECPVVIKQKIKPFLRIYSRTVEDNTRIEFSNVFVKSPALDSEGDFMDALPPVIYRLAGYATLYLDAMDTAHFPTFRLDWKYINAEVPGDGEGDEVEWIEVEGDRITKNKEIVDLLFNLCTDNIPLGYLLLPSEIRLRERHATPREMRKMGVAKLDELNIKERRTKAEPKITLAEISELSGISINGIRNVELGLVKNPSPATLTAIESALSALERQRQADSPS